MRLLKIAGMCVLALGLSFTVTACGDSKPTLSAKTAMMMGGPEGKGKYWYYDGDATARAREEAIKENTGITAEIKLEGDVGAMANMVAEKHLVFYLSKDGTKMMWQRTSGEGLLESQKRGYWKWQDEGETTLVLQDNVEPNAETDTVWKMIEVTEDGLVMQKQDDTTFSPKFYKKTLNDG